jgi:7-cyano-7-deazaguanine synthase in queuosine biosynthesis
MAGPAVVLLSGGLDSATTLAAAQAEGFECYALSFDYGQRHAREIESARRVATALGAKEHLVLKLDLRAIGGSALTAEIPIPKGRSAEAMASGIPLTYVPARNTIFLSHALAWAEVLGAQDIFIGVNALDYSVAGDAYVWVKTPRWARPMPIQDFFSLPEHEYQTLAVDPDTLRLGWRKVTGRFRHRTSDKRCFRLRLERGQSLTITEDHSLFTIDLVTARITTIKGSHVGEGTPIVVPFDLSDVADVWSEDLKELDLSGLVPSYEGFHKRRSIQLRDGYITNRLGKTRLPLQFPVDDDFLYIVGLWLAEGGKDKNSLTSTLSFSVGGIPGAVDTLRNFFRRYAVEVSKSPANNYDYAVHSSVLVALFKYLGLLGTAKRGEKTFPRFFWELSQRQRRLMVAGLWDGDRSHVFKGESIFAQKSHAIVNDLYRCLSLDGIFPTVKDGRHSQLVLIMRRADDFRRFVEQYPLRHTSKLASFRVQAAVKGRDQATGLWKCLGLWDVVSSAALPPGEKTKIYNAGGKYDVSFRAQRSAFRAVSALGPLVSSKLAFLRITDIEETSLEWMYDLAVEGAENFLANGILAHNSGYPDCRPEYIEAFERMANVATKAGVEGKSRFKVHAPLITLSKAEIIKLGVGLGVDFALTWSCYEPQQDGRPCGLCDSCLLRKKGFAEAGLTDPAASGR